MGLRVTISTESTRDDPPIASIHTAPWILGSPMLWLIDLDGYERPKAETALLSVSVLFTRDLLCSLLPPSGCIDKDQMGNSIQRVLTVVPALNPLGYSEAHSSFRSRQRGFLTSLQPQDPHRGRRELIAARCPGTST